MKNLNNYITEKLIINKDSHNEPKEIKDFKKIFRQYIRENIPILAKNGFTLSDYHYGDKYSVRVEFKHVTNIKSDDLDEINMLIRNFDDEVLDNFRAVEIRRLQKHGCELIFTKK